jgi:hypothetical protein
MIDDTEGACTAAHERRQRHYNREGYERAHTNTSEGMSS